MCFYCFIECFASVVLCAVCMLQCFNEAHAANLLLGDGKEVMRLFREKFNKKLVNLKYKPFMLFR